jgi:hypothetical protein
VTTTGVVTWLAVRELWMSFRLFVILVAYVVAGATVAFLPAPVAVGAGRLAAATAVATLVASVVAAWTLADERRSGRTGWLIARAVPRSSYLSGWFAALAATALAGHVTALALGWVAMAGVTLRPDAVAYLVVAGATLPATVAGLGLGVLAGALLPRMAAATATAAGGLALGVLSWAGAATPTVVPGVGAFAALAGYRETGTPIGPALVAAGIGLAGAAALLVLARIVLERAEL